jgi:hypothetical protein
MAAIRITESRGSSQKDVEELRYNLAYLSIDAVRHSYERPECKASTRNRPVR